MGVIPYVVCAKCELNRGSWSPPLAVCGVGYFYKNRFQGPLLFHLRRCEGVSYRDSKSLGDFETKSWKKFPWQKFCVKRLFMFINRISYNRGRSRGCVIRGQVRFWLSHKLGFIMGFITGK